MHSLLQQFPRGEREEDGVPIDEWTHEEECGLHDALVHEVEGGSLLINNLHRDVSLCTVRIAIAPAPAGKVFCRNLIAISVAFFTHLVRAINGIGVVEGINVAIAALRSRAINFADTRCIIIAHAPITFLELIIGIIPLDKAVSTECACRGAARWCGGDAGT